MKRVILLLMPLLICMAGCVSKEEAREAAVEDFERCQANMETAMSPYLYVVREDTQPEDNYEASDYYIRYYTIELDDATWISVMLESCLSEISKESHLVSITMSHTYALGSGEPESHLSPFAAIVQATGNQAVTKEFCLQFLTDSSLGVTGDLQEQYNEKYYISEDGQTFLYYYDDAEYSWKLSYEGTLMLPEESSNTAKIKTE